MCGITGFIDFSKRSDINTLKLMTKSIIHRGPDDEGEELFDLSNATVGFGFRRLAIIDLSPFGHQPMKNSSNNDWIVFNGEIYNFKEIKNELIAQGHTFISTSDTEVILKAYQQWGVDCVQRFIGMFAIVIFDVTKNKIICFRDRVGVKPFFYYQKNNLFLFASELKCFHAHKNFEKEIDESALASFFQHGYIPAPSSIFKNVFKLKPGHWLVLDLATSKITTHQYWNINSTAVKEKLKINYQDAKVQLESLLVSAFNYRLIADVPVGVFLSGGYDSTCVAAILQKTNNTLIKTYTIGFDEPGFNEAVFAKEVAKHIQTDHHEYYCTFKEAQEIIPLLPDIYDEPFGDSSAIPTTLVSKIARQHVTVALSADGGDELFAGYPRHLKSFDQIKKLNSVPTAFKYLSSNFIGDTKHDLSKSDRKNKLKRLLESRTGEEMFDIINQTYTKSELASLLVNNISFPISAFDDRISEKNVDLLTKILSLEFNTYLPDDILHKVDRASMSVSLEGREPFLDHRIAEYVAQLPSAFKMNAGKQKIILKDIVHSYVPRVIMERPKMGFGVPVEKWCRGELKVLFMEFMSDKALGKSGLLNVEAIIPIRQSYLNGSLENFERIWFIFIFQQWYHKWM